MYYKEKWCTAGGKDPLFGHVDGFQIDPKIFRKDFNQEIVSDIKCAPFFDGWSKWSVSVPIRSISRA